MFADGNDFSWETIEKGRNRYYQKQTADQIDNQTRKTISLLTSALNIHLNLGQYLTINTSSIFLSLTTLSIQSIRNRTIEAIGNAQIHLPSIVNVTNNQSIFSIQTIMQPLASADQSQSNTNLSTSISLSLFDQNGNELSIPTTSDLPYRLIIPNDPNIIQPSMTLQNVTGLYSTPHHLLFNLHYIDILQSNHLTRSVHIEMKVFNESVGYLFVYRFDSSPHLNSSINQIDGWTLFCPSGKLFSLFSSLIFG